MKYFLATIFYLLSFQFLNAQKIDTTTTFDWDTSTHQFIKSTQQVFNYNNACHLSKYAYNFWDSTSATYKKYYRTTNSLLSNNAILQSLSQLYDDVNNKWDNYQKGMYYYTLMPTQPSSVIYQNWNSTVNSFKNSRQYIYTYDASGNNTSILIQDWVTAGSTWANLYLYTYQFSSTNKITSFLQQNWNGSNSTWSNNNKIVYTYSAADKAITDSGQKWNSLTATWVNNFQSIYAYDANNFITTYNYNVWDTITQTFLQYQQYNYTNNALGNILETLTLSYNGSTWDTTYNDVNHYNSCLLPVDLISFTATNSKENVQLNWQTGNEINVSHFNIQRSTNSQDFENIGQVNAGKETGNKYSFNDIFTSFLLVNKNIYYRLEVLDKDGSKTYSDIKQVYYTKKELLVKIFPNPIIEFLNIKGKDIKEVIVTDLMGRLVLRKSINISGISNTKLSFNNKGVFILKVIDFKGESFTEKLVIE